MSFWSTEKLKQELPAQAIVDPYQETRVKNASYELSVGPEAVVSGQPTKTQLEPNGQVAIPPGQFAHVLTEETVNIPVNAMAFISVRTRVKQTGLINVSGFHVDPGFRGRLIFSVYNAGVNNVVLSRGSATFLIWFADLDQPTKDKYDGKRFDQQTISDEVTMGLQGTAASPPELARRLGDLEGRVSRWFAAAKWILLTLLGILLATTARNLLEHRPVAGGMNVRSDSTGAPNLSVGSTRESLKIKPDTTGRHR